jgi:hypothetical protein
MLAVSDIPWAQVLDPMERISETLFGLIMVLTFICSLGVATAGNIDIQTMLIGALGCNLAWGIVDGGLYLLARINERGGNVVGALHGVAGHFDLVPPPTPTGSGCLVSLRIGIGASELAASRAGDTTLRAPPVVTLSAIIA